MEFDQKLKTPNNRVVMVCSGCGHPVVIFWNSADVDHKDQYHLECPHCGNKFVVRI